jgi:ferric-dicitrate binding protein FerR (iron transport regulator)
MSDAPTSPASGYSAGDSIRPLSVRMLDSSRAQLEILAQLNGRSVTEEVRLALEAWIEKSKSDPSVLARAEEVRADIEREAAVRREAIQSIFDPVSAKPSRGRTKGGDGE